YEAGYYLYHFPPTHLAMNGPESTPLLIPRSSSSIRSETDTVLERDAQGPPTRVTPGEREAKTGPIRSLGLWNGIALVLGLQIGSGFFSSPSLVARNTGPAYAALAVWCVAGIVTWACAACYIELGTRLPVNGGPQEYLAYCFNDLLAFLAS
ncbi:hypothetical protein MMC17_007356, partial [Xylographa soralifera]|nr:hypothetical protein [Xylographa soralifera]